MNKVLTPSDAIRIAEDLKKRGKKIVLAGGCFDILHIGHIEFLKRAKKQGNYLFVLLESDQTIEKIKGKNRPINIHKDRARVLETLQIVDYVIPLPHFKTDEDYDDLITKLKPDTIATTRGDPGRSHKERQAKLINAKVLDVVGKISSQSTTRLVKLLSKDYWL